MVYLHPEAMLRHAVRLLQCQARNTAQPSLIGGVRHFAEAPSTVELPDSFKDVFKKVAPNLDLPKTPASFLKPRPPVPSTIPEKLTVNFALPHELPFMAKQADQVIVPATSGQMGVLPGHVPTIAELKPGVLSIVEGGVETKFFVSSGFAFIHANSVLDVCAIEAVPLDKIDPEEVKKGLASYTTKLGTAVTELEKAEAQIGVEVHAALNSALGL